MADHPSAINKITPPQLRQVLPRYRLFEKIDQAHPIPAFWVSGPAGAGKTTLIANYLAERKIPCLWYRVDEGDNDLSSFFYHLCRAATGTEGPPLPLLTPEYLPGVETFAKRYFENLFQRLAPPYWLVLDNYQEVDEKAPLHNIIRLALDRIPPTITAAIVSRNQPPPVMSRLLANRKLGFITWQDLAFSENEVKGIIELLTGRQLYDQVVRQLHVQTRGWIAGLILWLLNSNNEQIPPVLSKNFTPTAIFDYFASELLERVAPPTRNFLLQTAMLPEMTAEMVDQLMKMESAADILEDLHRRNFFLEKSQIDKARYEYHPLFRNFLQAVAYRTFGTEACQALCSRAADILAGNGLAEEAIALFSQARDFEPLVGLITSLAPALTAQGRHQTLTSWIGCLPAVQISKHPWLLFWKGIGLMPTQPLEGQALCMRAYEQFTHADDLMGQIISWSAVIEAFCYLRGSFIEVDSWIVEGERLAELIPKGLDPDVYGGFSGSMLAALLLRNPGHSDFERWQEECEALFQRCSNQHVVGSLGIYLSWSYAWLGQAQKAFNLLTSLTPLLEAPNVTQTFLILGKILVGTIRLAEGRSASCRQTVNEALSLSNKAGVHIYDSLFLAYGAFSSLTTGDLENADNYLERYRRILAPHAIWDAGQYHFLAGWAALLGQKWQQAKFHTDRSIELAETCGTPFPIAYSTISRAWLLIESGDISQAEKAMDRIRSLQVLNYSALMNFMYELTNAACAYVKDRNEKMLLHLNAAFSAAAEHGIMMPFGMIRKHLSALCAAALQAGIQPEFVAEFITRIQLPPPDLSKAGDLWPWSVKLRTLGFFEIQRHGKPIKLSVKTPKKPLELLELLVCRGQRGITKDRAADLLWPAAEGDRALQTLDTTLHRLRRLIGDDQAVVLEGGRLTLSPQRCWIDAWYLETLLNQAEPAVDQETKGHLLGKAVDIYQGHFGIADHNDAPAASYAERIKTRWIRAIISLAKISEASGKIEQAVVVYQKGLQVDDAAEPIYLNLMQALHQCGRQRQALETFHRCRRALSTKLGLMPSAETQALYRKIQSR